MAGVDAVVVDRITWNGLPAEDNWFHHPTIVTATSGRELSRGALQLMIDVVGKAASLALLMIVGTACSPDRPRRDTAELSPTAARGRDIAARLGCVSCHQPDDGPAVGPDWTGSWGTNVELDDGTTVVFDADFVADAVRTPAAQQRRGDWPQMPAFEPDQLSDAELDAIVAYLEALGGGAP